VAPRLPVHVPRHERPDPGLARRRLFEAFGGDIPTWKVVGWMFYAFPVGGGRAVGPAIGAGVLVAGVLYPTVLGAVGGAVASLTVSDDGATATPQL
jgi:hypothetical protein